MIWNLSCRKTRRLLALSAGNDFEERPAAETQRHLAVCPHCRETWQGLRQAQRVLERVSAARVEVRGVEGARVEGQIPAVSDRPEEAVCSPPSVWPGVARHLKVIDEQVVVPNWRGWLPAGALAAACLAIVLVTIPDPRYSIRTAENRQPVVIYPQHASVESNGPGFRNIPGAAFSDADRDLPELGRDHPVQLFQGDDEPRSF